MRVISDEREEKLFFFWRGDGERERVSECLLGALTERRRWRGAPQPWLKGPGC